MMYPEPNNPESTKHLPFSNSPDDEENINAELVNDGMDTSEDELREAATDMEMTELSADEADEELSTASPFPFNERNFVAPEVSAIHEMYLIPSDDSDADELEDGLG